MTPEEQKRWQRLSDEIRNTEWRKKAITVRDEHIAARDTGPGLRRDLRKAGPRPGEPGYQSWRRIVRKVLGHRPKRRAPRPVQQTIPGTEAA